ncbi:hypothetical protein BKN51_14100 [Amycolatopsis sp. BJA-103]|nr:hypothetical protein BKN51_14100 [Amycolatopsis sp. BJA-103]
MVRVVSGVSRVVVVAGVSGGDDGAVFRGLVAGAFVVVPGSTWPVPDPPPAHAPSSTPAPTTRPQHHTRMSRDPNSRPLPGRPFPEDSLVVSSALLDSGHNRKGGVDS